MNEVELYKKVKTQLATIPDTPPICDFRATGRVMVEVVLHINGVPQPIPPMWMVAETEKKKRDEH